MATHETPAIGLASLSRDSTYIPSGRASRSGRENEKVYYDDLNHRALDDSARSDFNSQEQLSWSIILWSFCRKLFWFLMVGLLITGISTIYQIYGGQVRLGSLFFWLDVFSFASAVSCFYADGFSLLFSVSFEGSLNILTSFQDYLLKTMLPIICLALVVTKVLPAAYKVLVPVPKDIKLQLNILRCITYFATWWIRGSINTSDLAMFLSVLHLSDGVDNYSLRENILWPHALSLYWMLDFCVNGKPLNAGLFLGVVLTAGLINHFATRGMTHTNSILLYFSILGMYLCEDPLRSGLFFMGVLVLLLLQSFNIIEVTNFVSPEFVLLCYFLQYRVIFQGRHRELIVFMTSRAVWHFIDRVMPSDLSQHIIKPFTEQSSDWLYFHGRKEAISRVWQAA